MHEDLVTPGSDPDVADTDRAQPIRPVTPLIRLGAPVVGDLEPTVAAPPRDVVEAEPLSDADEAAPAPADNSVLRRAALLRLVGLGRARALR